jgi:hypothetical protein
MAPETIKKLRVSYFLQPPPNNSFNPTALSLLFMFVYCFNSRCVAVSGGGLIRALGASGHGKM